MNAELAKLIKTVSNIRDDVDGLKSPQLSRSSLENAWINSYIDGQLGIRLGTQYDGTSGAAVLNGPIPPTPAWSEATGPSGESVIGGIKLRWEGEWEQMPDDLAAGRPTVAPMDFMRVELHTDVNPPDVGDALNFATLRGSSSSPRGGDFFVSPTDNLDRPLYAWLVARSTAGKPSAASQVIGPFSPGKIREEDLSFDITALGGTTVYWGEEEPTEAVLAGDLWLRKPDNVAFRYVDGTWVQVADQRIAQALQDAADAATRAASADGNALAALGVAEDAQEAAGSASGLAQSASQAATAASTAASNAQTTASNAATAASNAATAASNANTKALEAAGIAANKGRVLYQASAPSTGTAFDLWIDSDDNRPYTWNGSTWIVRSDAGIAAAATAAGTAQSAADNAATAASNAAAAAVAAKKAADDAQATANSANTLAGLAKTSADAKITVYRQSAAPTGGTYKPNGDLWIDSDDGKLYVATTTTGTWVLSDDQRIATALTNAGTAQTAANTAQSTANTKITVFAQTAAPSTTGRTLGDVWVDTDDGNKLYVWEGATPAWTLRQDTSIASAALLAGQAKTSADSKITVYRQSAAPAGGTYKVNGDLWIDSDDGKLYVATTTTGTWVESSDARIATALTQASAANTAVGTKTTVFAQISAPSVTARTVGDVWLDTDDDNKWYDWNGAAWVVRQWGAGAISATARQLGAITTYRQSTAPTTGMITNDLWIDSDDNKLYAYSGTGWVVSQDTGIAAALAAAGTAQTAAAGKTTVFYQPTSPATTGRTTGDLWVDTSNSNRISTWNGTAWTITQWGAAALNVTARQLGAITTYRQASAPTDGVLVGDFWIDSDDNKLYRWEGATPSWVLVQDAAIQTAITNAATATALADGKARIFVQDSAPTGLVAGDVGDTWVETDAGNVLWTWSGTAWQKRQIGSGAIQPNSLVAKDVIATGTISAALLEAIMVIANRLVSGDPNAARVEFNATGLEARDANNTRTFRLDGPTGSAEMSGRITTKSNSGNYIILDTNLSNLKSGNVAAPGLLFWTPYAVNRYSQIYTLSTALVMDSPAFTGTDGVVAIGASFQVGTTGIFGYTEGASMGSNLDTFQLRNDGYFRLGYPGTGTRVYMDSDTAASTAANWRFGNATSGTNVRGNATGFWTIGEINSVNAKLYGNSDGSWNLGSPKGSVWCTTDGSWSLNSPRGSVYANAAGWLLGTGDRRVYGNADGTWGLGHVSDQSLFSVGSTLRIRGHSSSGPVEVQMAGGSWFDVWDHGHTATGAQMYVHGTLGAAIKNFIIDHPLDPENKDLVHSSTESPWAGVEYWGGEAVIGENGEVDIELPDYFEALTHVKGRAVLLTPIGRAGEVGASRVVDGAFTVFGPANSEVSWVVKARRKDAAAAFEPVRDKVAPTVEPPVQMARTGSPVKPDPDTGEKPPKRIDVKPRPEKTKDMGVPVA